MAANKIFVFNLLGLNCQKFQTFPAQNSGIGLFQAIRTKTNKDPTLFMLMFVMNRFKESRKKRTSKHLQYLH